MDKKLKITKTAKNKAKKALEKRKSMPSSRKFGLSSTEARKKGITSGVSRARQIIRSDSLPMKDARRVAAFYQRFRNKTGERAEGAIDLWGGREFGKKAVKFVEKHKQKGR